MSEKAGVSCSECGQAFSKTGNLYRHYRAQHAIEITTRVCEPGAGTVRCPHCHRLFSKNSNMYRHCKLVHKVDVKPPRSECDPNAEVSETAGLPELMRAVLSAAESLSDPALGRLLQRAAEVDEAAKQLLNDHVT